MPKRTTRNVYPYDSVKHGTLWRARYVSPSNRIVEKRGFLTKAEAEAWLTTEKSKLITGDWTDPRKSTVTVGSLAPAWLDIKSSTVTSRRGSARSTVRRRSCTARTGCSTAS